MVRTAHIELHVAVLLFGVAGLFGKLVSASPAIIVFGRTFFAALVIFLGLRFYRVGLAISSRRALPVILASGLVLAVHWLAFFHAIQLSTIAVGLVGYATFPVFVTFLEPLLSGQKHRAIDFVSAALVVLGLVLVAPGFSLEDKGLVGLLWAIFSGVLFAVLTLMNRRLVANDPPFIVVFYQLSVAALCLFPFVVGKVTELDSRNLWLLLFLGVLCTAVPHTLFIKSLGILKAQLASVVSALEPVYGIALAIIFLHEIPELKTLLGAALVLGAVLLAMSAHAQEPKTGKNKADGG